MELVDTNNGIIQNIFVVFAPNYILCVLTRSASKRRSLLVPRRFIYLQKLQKKKKKQSYHITLIVGLSGAYEDAHI